MEPQNISVVVKGDQVLDLDNDGRLDIPATMLFLLTKFSLSIRRTPKFGHETTILQFSNIFLCVLG
jgi:hypothetical protein